MTEEYQAASDDNIGGRARTAAGWKFLSQAITTGLQTVTSIVLARLLMPADFGILAMAATVIGLARVFQDLGLGQALVQRQEIAHDHARSAFWGSLIMGLILCGAVILVAPYVGVYFGEPRMAPVLRFISLTFVLAPFAVVPRSLLQRNLDFRTPFFAELASSVAYGGTGISMALLGYGYWSLVGAAMAGAIVGTVVVCILTRYLPPLIPTFRGIADLYAFGVGMTLWGIAGYAVDQIDYLIVGRRLDARALGLYSRAFEFSRLPTRLTHSVLTSVLFPVFARITADPVRFRSAFRQSIAVIGLVAIPPTVLIGVAAPELIPALMGPQWADAVVPLQILCAIVLHRALMSPGGAALKALGEVFWISALVGIHGVLVLAGAWIGTAWGINGVAVGVLAAYLTFFVMHAILLTRRVPGWSMRDIAQGMSGPLLVSGCVLAAASLVRYLCVCLNMSNWAVLGSTLTSGVVAAVLTARVVAFPDGLKPFEELRRYVKARLVH